MKPGWWKSLTEDDPVTLEPLANLTYPPFELKTAGVTHYFDGVILATYIVSQGRFENPLTREALSREDCRNLDQYVFQHDPEWSGGRGGVTVTDSYDLQQTIKVRGPGGGGDAEEQRVMALRREATTALLGLFEFRGVRWHQRGRSTRGADEAGGGGLTIIDDDEEDAIGLPGADADAQGDNDSFPWLSERIARLHLDGGASDTIHYSRLAQDLERARHEQETGRERRSREAKAAKDARSKADAEYRAKRKEEFVSDAAKKEKELAERERAELLRVATQAEREEAEWRLVEDVQSVEAAVERAAYEEEVKRREAERVEARREAERLEEVAKREAEAAKERAEEEKKEKERERRRRQREREKAKKAGQREAKEKEEREAAERKKEEEAKAAASLKCAMCGSGIVKHPFARLEFSYCTTKCVQEHRKQLGR